MKTASSVVPSRACAPTTAARIVSATSCRVYVVENVTLGDGGLDGACEHRPARVEGGQCGAPAHGHGLPEFVSDPHHLVGADVLRYNEGGADEVLQRG